MLIELFFNTQNNFISNVLFEEKLSDVDTIDEDCCKVVKMTGKFSKH